MLLHYSLTSKKLYYKQNPIEPCSSPMEIENILVVDDEPLIRKLLDESLKRLGYTVHLANGGSAALDHLKKETIDLVITDLQMPSMDGITLLQKMRQEDPELMVVIITAFASVENVINALRYGAFDYLLKPVSPESLEAVIDKAKSHKKLIRENQFLKKETSSCRLEHQMITRSETMLSIMDEVDKVAKSNASVFIHGESGSGKEVIAQEIHRRSPRYKEAFVRINCPAISPTLLESEFFGHEKGAFTGAETKKIGRLELAHQGTMLLDEVTEIPLNLQPKLLRAIQEKEFERVGSSKPLQSDIRFISTSNRDMQKTIEEGHFRSDLYYRLNVIPILIPPLRKRPEDILPLAQHYLEKLAKENHKRPPKLSKEAKEALLSYNWPGNVRELINVIERSVVLSQDEVLQVQDLKIDAASTEQKTLEEKIKETEKRYIEQVLKKSKNQSEGAKKLGLTPAALLKKLKEYSLTPQ